MAWTECNVVNIEKPTLLWTNSSPDSAFAAQTIDIDVRNYKAIGFLIKNRRDDATNAYETYIVRTKPIGGADAIGVSNTPSSVSYPQVRGYTINSSTGNIVFSNSINTYGNSADNNFNIPLKLYGYENLPTPSILNLKNVNPNLSAAQPFVLALKYYSGTSTYSSTCIYGYSKAKIKAASASGYSIKFYDNTGTSVGSVTTLTSTNWTQITIPSGAYVMQAMYTGTSSSTAIRSVCYALIV